MRVTFAVTAGPHQGQVFHFTQHDTFVVGRSKRAHFQLPEKDEYFSRIHFLVEVNPPHCRLMDMGSTNGTYVNGQKVTLADLRDGDLIQGGQTVLRVAVDFLGEEPATRRADVPPSAAAPLAQTGARPPQAPTTVAPAPRRLASTIDHVLPIESDPAAPSGRPLVAGYEVLEELGRGGMGVVCKARRLADGQVVALKTLKPAADPTPQAIEQFLREVAILRQLDHPHIIAFTDTGESNGQLYFAMDFVEGVNAARLLDEQGPLALPRAVGLVCQLLEALAYAHDRRFVHRDIKPANVMVTQVDGREVVKLIDFGLARVYQASQLSGLTMLGQLGGTVPFMAPEQITNFREARPAVDQYAAAATLYKLLTNRYVHDFPEQPFQKRLLMILQNEPIPIRERRHEVPEELARLIHRALARDPAGRFPYITVLRQALLKFCP
jgi:serine/threonine-protein kinase